MSEWRDAVETWALLEAAADRLMQLAEDAARVRGAPKPQYDWVYDGNPSGWVRSREEPGYSVGTMSTWDGEQDGGRIARYVVAMSPRLGIALARWLQIEAAEINGRLTRVNEYMASGNGEAIVQLMINDEPVEIAQAVMRSA